MDKYPDHYVQNPKWKKIDNGKRTGIPSGPDWTLEAIIKLVETEGYTADDGYGTEESGYEIVALEDLDTGSAWGCLTPRNIEGAFQAPDDWIHSNMISGEEQDGEDETMQFWSTGFPPSSPPTIIFNPKWMTRM